MQLNNKSFMNNRKFGSIIFACALFISGCASAPRVKKGFTPQELLAVACATGKETTSVSGHVWLKIDSKEVSGQYPADVSVVSPSEMKIEITNIFGGTEALIAINGKFFEVSRGTQQNSRKEKGYGSWSGIPLAWATDLFLGRIPCPDSARKWKLDMGKEGELLVETGGPEAVAPEKYVYRFRDIQGKPWPDSLKWEIMGTRKNAVDFSFEDPDEKSHSPLKWEAQSSEGRLRVRWRDRTPGVEASSRQENSALHKN
jgi:hypothetical protein